MLKFTCVAVVALLAAACSSSSDTSDPESDTPNRPRRIDDSSNLDAGTRQSPQSPDSGASSEDDEGQDVPNETPVEGADAAPPPDGKSLAGTFAMYAVLADVQDSPLGKLNGKTTFILRAVQTHLGTSLGIKFKTCSFAMDTGSKSVTIEVPDAFIQSVGEDTGAGKATPDGDGVSVTAGPIISVHGAKLKKRTDALPTTESDPRVIDQDNDNHPGVTVRVKSSLPGVSGEIYLVQRLTLNLSGKGADYDSLDGLVKWKAEHVLLKSTSPAVTSFDNLKSDPDASKSFFRYRRISDSMTCASIVSKSKELFGI